MERRSNCWIVYLVGIGFGILEALIWLGGFMTGVRFIIPYAAADAMLILALTTIIAIAVRHLHCDSCFTPYIIATLIAASIFLIFVQIFVGATLTYTLKVILAFVGALSFWTMLVTFIALVIRIVNRR